MGKKEYMKLEKEEVDDKVQEGQVGQESQKAEKKSKKSKRKEFDEDDIAKELEEMALEANGEVSKEKEERMSESLSEPEKISKGKKSKNKRRVKDDDQELDDILAELEAEYNGEKLPDKVKESAESESQNKNSSKVTFEKTHIDEKRQKIKKEKTQGSKKENSKGKSIEESKSSKSNDKKSGKSKEESTESVEEGASRKGKPNKRMLEAMKEALAKQKEAEERFKKEQDEREKHEQERIRQYKEQLRIEKEKKERLKQKQKDRMKRLKEEGKVLTPKQKLEQKRAQAMLEHLKAQGMAIPGAGEKLPAQSPMVKRPKKKKEDEEKPQEQAKEETNEAPPHDGEVVPDEVIEPDLESEDDGLVEDWDQLSESNTDQGSYSEGDDETSINGKMGPEITTTEAQIEESEEMLHMSEAEKRRVRALRQMEQRKLVNEQNRSKDRLRAPVVCVLGHVDHGKTKILDKLRRTNVQEGEVGGITQQIGATNVPLESIRSQTRMVKNFALDSVNLPGLLIIDTPGHESFSNLRSRGSSLCDIAILVVDITQGLEPQTIESINLLKKRKTPFVVALNKVDRVFEWESHPSKDISDTINLQNVASQRNFEKRSSEIMQALNMEGLNAALFWENPDPRSYVNLVPTSAISGDGMGNLMAMMVTLCHQRLAKRLMYSHELQCTVLEVKTIQGHGTTIDVILINGELNEGDTIVLAGTEGPIVTQIRSLLIPKPMKEIRVKGQYDELKTVQAALGVKIAARELEKSIAGLNLQVAKNDDETEILKEHVDKEFKAAMRSIKVKDRGVYVQASTLGALEALLEFFKANDVPYSGIRVGPVVKRDVMRAAAMLEHNPMYAVILAFDVKVEKDAQDLADKEGIKIFSEETIYHLGDRYVEYLKEYKRKKQDEFKHIAVFPCKLKIIPDAIFNKRDPIVLGVNVEAGLLRIGTLLCVPSKEFVDIGVVTSLEFDHKVVDVAKKGVNVCIKIEPMAGHTPKLFGRHFDADDLLVSKISRESIDACKEHFRDDLGKNEWKLMAELKKLFAIL